jgi:hypothetical protein
MGNQPFRNKHAEKLHKGGLFHRGRHEGNPISAHMNAAFMFTCLFSQSSPFTFLYRKRGFPLSNAVCTLREE